MDVLPGLAGEPWQRPDLLRPQRHALTAYNLGKKPDLPGPGIMYRLQGGSDPSLTDPAALEPAKGRRWISHPPHIVIVSPQKLNPADYGSYGADAWIMWPGTPYEHLHLPVGNSSKCMHG